LCEGVGQACLEPRMSTIKKSSSTNCFLASSFYAGIFLK